MFIAICDNSVGRSMHIIVKTGFLDSYTISSYSFKGPLRHKRLSKKLIFKHLKKHNLDYNMKRFLFPDTKTSEQMFEEYNLYKPSKIYSISYD